MQIIAYAWELHPSSHYRAFQPLLELAHRGHMVAIHTRPEELTPSDAELEELAETFDVAFIARYIEPEAVALARRLTEAGVPVVWDFDDDVLASRAGRTDDESLRRIAGVRGMFDTVDVVTTTNERLAARFLEEGARHAVAIPNYVTRPALEAPPRPHEGLVLGYIGWVDHQADWERLGLVETINELLEDHDQLRVETVGPLDFDLPAERWTRHEAVPFEQLPALIAGFDLALAPLSDLRFNYGRSDIKLKEYAIAGVPWLASPVGPYAEHGEEQGGRLVADDAWFDEIDRLVLDKRARKKLAKRGQKWALGHTLPRRSGEWEAALREAIDVASAEPAV
jgi:glycosyltransferase involved in cell wall biosynthesis